ncbi:MAG: NlpC/P60 family protein [Spirochaetia bacterium]|nr:NlpC/P60 family protein [Spirochaetia bacterium]MDY3886864.1 NlpC/P60 family protein [Treponema sp.]
MNIKKILSVVLISSFSVLTFAQESENDDIFKNQSVQKNDFYEITVEPSTQEISSGITKYFEEVKQKKLNIYKRLENERNKLNSAKKSVNAAKENQKSSLEKKKEALKNPKSKNKTSETPENAKKSSSQKQKKSNSVKTEEKDKIPELKEPIQPVTVEEAEQKFDETIGSREKFIACGMDYKGTQYVWGGKTPVPGFDCSGLVTFTAKKSLNLDLKGNAQDIYNQTKPVLLSDALPGDLIFFKGDTDTRITHVGIYLGKNPGKNDFGNQNLFLNAASGGPRTGVIVSGLNENYWKKTFYGCTRILDSIE